MVLELNASDDRGIDVVREQIKTFASTKQIFSMSGGAAKSNSIAGFKLIILDEADAMTNTAQMALRRIMEKYTANTRFCIIANYAHKLSPALLSRCTRFRFSPLKEGDIRVLVEKVVEEENVKIQGEAVDALVKLSKGDMRRALNVLQACHASSESLHSQANQVYMIWEGEHKKADWDFCYRHAIEVEERAQAAGERDQARDDYDRDDLQLHCGAAARSHHGDCGDAAEHAGRDELPQHHQRAEDDARTGAGRHHYGGDGAADEAGGECRGHDYLAGRAGGD